jgi:hypothetical protein
MSYDVDLVGAGPVEHFTDGGNYVLGGTDEASLNITWNYSQFYYWFLDEEAGLRALNGCRAGDWIERLAAAVEKLGTHRYDDYAPTAGNAGVALDRLLGWARQYPDAVFEVR